MKLRTRIAHEIIFWLVMAGTFAGVYWVAALLFEHYFGFTYTLVAE